jgi:hypothetical protein
MILTLDQQQEHSSTVEAGQRVHVHQTLWSSIGMFRAAVARCTLLVQCSIGSRNFTSLPVIDVAPLVDPTAHVSRLAEQLHSAVALNLQLCASAHLATTTDSASHRTVQIKQ